MNVLYSVFSGTVDVIGSVTGIAGVLCVVLVAKLELRVPSWTDSAAAVVVNGNECAGIVPGEIFRIEREWRDGDVVVLDFPMKTTVSGVYGGKGRKTATLDIVQRLCRPFPLQSDSREMRQWKFGVPFFGRV